MVMLGQKIRIIELIINDTMVKEGDFVDYTRYPLSGRYYTGAERKKGILVKGEAYIVKYAKNSPDGMTFSYISEYLGSHLFLQAGFEAQQTMLGTCDGCNVVVIKDFIGEGEQFVPFNDIGDSSLERDKENYKYTYEDIMLMLRENTKLTSVEETCSSFWDMYIMDAWIGNFDRHGANWGFLKKNNRYCLAPVYDNGSSLFPRLNTDEKLLHVLNSKEEMDKRIYQFPTSQILLNGRKSSYYEVIDSLNYEECNKALIRMKERIHLDAMESFVKNIENISQVRQEFYCTMLQERYVRLLEEPYYKLTGRR